MAVLMCASAHLRICVFGGNEKNLILIRYNNIYIIYLLFLVTSASSYLLSYKRSIIYENKIMQDSGRETIGTLKRCRPLTKRRSKITISLRRRLFNSDTTNLQVLKLKQSPKQVQMSKARCKYIKYTINTQYFI